MSHRARGVHLNCLLRQAELVGRIFASETLDFIEEENFTTPRWQARDGFGKQCDAFASPNVVNHIASIFYDAQRAQMPYAVDRRTTNPPEMIKCKPASHSEKETFRRTNLLGCAGLPHAQVRLLNDVFDVSHGRKRPLKIRAERRSVDMHLLGKPALLARPGWRLGNGGGQCHKGARVGGVVRESSMLVELKTNAGALPPELHHLLMRHR